MKVTDETFHGISDLIEAALKDAVTLAASYRGVDDFTLHGIAHNTTAQICQNLDTP